MRITRGTRVAALAAAGALMLAACGGDDGGGSSADPTGGETTGATSGSDDGITIGIKFDQPGLGLQEGSEFTGFDVDVARYVAGELGYTEDQITFVESPSQQRENMLQNNQVDMIFATYSITDDRKKLVSFAGPYFVAGQDLLVRADDTEITGPDTLDGKVLCSVEGSTSAERIREEYAEGVELYPTVGYSECVELLTAGTVDAVTTDDVILAGFAAQPQYEGQLKVVGNPFSEERYGIGLNQDSDLCEDINAAVEKMVADGDWERILAENVGDSFTPDPTLNPPTELEACS